jgi:GT2 family glycosyltransferase/SAM-dependent methyltransferase
VDISTDAVEHARKRYIRANLDFRHGSCADIPMETSSVDIVVSFETIEHHNEHDAMLREIKRVLRPNGVLIISSPDKLECTDKPGRTNPHHVKELYRDEFILLLRKYFMHNKLYAQRVVYGSAIFQEDAPAPASFYTLADNMPAPASALPYPMFFLVTASDANLQELPNSFMEQSLEQIEEVLLLKTRIAQLEAQILHVRRFEALSSKTARKLYEIARKIYWKFPLLQTLRHTFRNYVSKVATIIHIHASKVLAERRFEEAACDTARQSPSPEEWPYIDVSIVLYNSIQWIDSFWSSLLAQDYPLNKLRLTFVDNGSTDDTADIVRRLIAKEGASFDAVCLIVQDNLGYGKGHDTAIRGGKSPFCFVTNVDVEFLPDTLPILVRTALSDTMETVASWETRQMPHEHPKHYDYVTLETLWSSHACILIRRSAYEKVGGYDPFIFMYTEDVELSYRLRSYGYVLKYVPRAVIIHHSYEDITRIKPVQHIGSIVGNIYMRFRYGRFVDAAEGALRAAACLLRPETFPGSRKSLLRALWKILPGLWKGHRKKGTATTQYPFSGFDYTATRTGSHWESSPLRFAADEFPLVSIVMRTYQGRGFLLRQAMQTVFNQTYPRIELIVSEDGGDSQKGLVDKMRQYAPSGYTVNFIANPKVGRSATGNAGMAFAQGRFLMFFDDDDLLYADHVETLLECLLRTPEALAAYAPGDEVRTEIDFAAQSYNEACNRTMDCLYQEWDYAVLCHHNYLVIHTLFRRELYEQRGGLEERIELMEDWNLWLRYGYANTFCYVPKTTSMFRTPADAKIAADRASVFHKANERSRELAFASLRQLGIMA